MGYRYTAAPEERVDIGFALKAPAMSIYEWLKKKWREPVDQTYGNLFGGLRDEEGNKLVEYILIRRRDSLIDYGIARYGYSISLIQKAYDRGDVATKYAAIANPRGSIRLVDAPDIVRRGNYSALRLLLKNKWISDDILIEILERQGKYEDISDYRMLLIASSLGKNERLKTEYDDLFLDGWTDYRYHRVFSAAWELARVLPANQQTASVLWEFLANTVPPTSMNNLDEVIERWKVDKPPKDPKIWHSYDQSFFVRSLIYGLVKNTDELHRSDDPAARVAFYKKFSPNDYRDWPSFLERDGQLFVRSALDNLSLWRIPDERERLGRVCWDCPDPHSNMDMPNDYRFTEKRMKEKHPDWFNDTKENIIVTSIRDLKEEVESLREAVITAGLKKKGGFFS